MLHDDVYRTALLYCHSSVTMDFQMTYAFNAPNFSTFIGFWLVRMLLTSMKWISTDSQANGILREKEIHCTNARVFPISWYVGAQKRQPPVPDPGLSDFERDYALDGMPLRLSA